MRERLLKTGATITTAVALGGLSMKSAEAQPFVNESTQSIANIEKGRTATHPPGIEVITSHSGIQKELHQTLSHLKERWNGVLVLYPPKKNAFVPISESPHAYLSPVVQQGPGSYDAILLVQPAIEKVGGRDYAAVYSYEFNKWGFVDIKWAADSGSLTSYAFKGSKPGPQRYDGSYLPPIVTPFNDYEDVQKREPLAATKDVYGKVRLVVPSKIQPHS